MFLVVNEIHTTEKYMEHNLFGLSYCQNNDIPYRIKFHLVTIFTEIPVNKLIIILKNHSKLNTVDCTTYKQSEVAI